MKQLSQKFVNPILDSVADGVFTVDTEWKVTFFNKAAEKITGVSTREAIGKLCREVFKAEVCENNCILAQTIETKKEIINKPIQIITKNGKKKPISISTALLKNNRGEIIGGVETFRDLSLVEELRKEVLAKYSLGDMISKSKKMYDIFTILPDIAESDSTVLIEGASGTGKEMVARILHEKSFRKKKPFIAVNCGALPDTLLESELFGYKAGAYTDAKKDKLGRFALAEGGTLFLDEIGDVSPALQVKLLRVLEERKYEPLGATKVVTANVRIITATNKNLSDLVKKEDFREDLFYRINVIKLSLPRLKDRKEDIPLLCEYFIKHFNVLKHKRIEGISDEALAELLKYDFPGNVRELKNIVEHAFILCKTSFIKQNHLPEYIKKDSSFDFSGKTLADIERKSIEAALLKNKGSKTKTAFELGIDKATLWRKMKRYK